MLRLVLEMGLVQGNSRRTQYCNPWGHLRIGRVLEDLDSLAGNIAFAHSDDGDAATTPPALVTAAVERIEMRAPVTMATDVTLGAGLAERARGPQVNAPKARRA